MILWFYQWLNCVTPTTKAYVFPPCICEKLGSILIGLQGTFPTRDICTMWRKSIVEAKQKCPAGKVLACCWFGCSVPNSLCHLPAGCGTTGELLPAFFQLMAVKSEEGTHSSGYGFGLRGDSVALGWHAQLITSQRKAFCVEKSPIQTQCLGAILCALNHTLVLLLFIFFFL